MEAMTRRPLLSIRDRLRSILDGYQQYARSRTAIFYRVQG